MSTWKTGTKKTASTAAAMIPPKTAVTSDRASMTTRLHRRQRSWSDRPRPSANVTTSVRFDEKLVP